jgi:hypothetical protein
VSKPAKPAGMVLCHLPADTINRTIETELEIAEVVLTRAAQTHAARRHPADYPKCFPHLARVIANPLYIGDDYRNPGYIELISAIPGPPPEFMLVAVNLELNEYGQYEVASFYLISEKKIASRRGKGYLKVAQKA